MSKDKDFPNIWFEGKLLVTSRENREYYIKTRRKLGWKLRVFPKKMGEAVAETIDRIFLEGINKSA